jgi:hypothetical protein
MRSMNSLSLDSFHTHLIINYMTLVPCPGGPSYCSPAIPTPLAHAIPLSPTIAAQTPCSVIADGHWERALLASASLDGEDVVVLP